MPPTFRQRPSRRRERGLKANTIPLGHCQCGCGAATRVAPQTRRSRGWVKGVPLQFVLGHKPPPPGPAWLEEGHGYTTPCWIWQRAMYGSGYGAKWFDGHMHNAHRAVYLELVGPIAGDLVLDHLCRVRACVNPDHMEPVTQAENSRRGDQTRLTAEQAGEIRSSPLSGPALSAQYGVTTTQIYAIQKDRKWRDA